MASIKSERLNNFIGGRNKTIEDVKDKESPTQGVEDSRFRVILDGYQRWRLVSCEPDSPHTYVNGHRYHSRSSSKTIEQTLMDVTGRSAARPRTSPDNHSASSGATGKHQSNTGSVAYSPDIKLPSLPTEITHQNEGTRLPNSARTSSRQSHTSYKDISEYTRANSFPGLGNSFWRTSFTEAYRKPQASPPWKHEKFYGIKTDNFMQWAESDVYRQRLMKAWDKYVSDKAQEEGFPQELNHTKVIPVKKAVIEPEKKTLPTKKKLVAKKVPKKTKPPDTGQNVLSKQPQSTVIEVRPAPNADNDDNFWEFYDKPFK